MDLLEAKSRIAEALAESIFRRARFEVRPYRSVEAPLRVGREDFSPDFSVLQRTTTGEELEFLVEVKYRPAIEQFVSVENQRGDRSTFFLVRQRWPRLYFVLVTDRPQDGRSCFQVIPLGDVRPGEPFRTVDLRRVREFRIFPHNVEDHEALARSIFGLLTA